jgi:hypothetical protein|nr:MAG TPA: hypothetical protein [Caudoviricetes sp.]
MDIEALLKREIEDEFEVFQNMTLGTDDYKMTIDGLTKLLDRHIELKKIDYDHEEKAKNREYDNQLKIKQMEEDQKDRWIKNGIAIASFVIPSLITIWGTKKSFEFEKTGTITTIMGRGFLNKLISKK